MKNTFIIIYKCLHLEYTLYKNCKSKCHIEDYINVLDDLHLEYERVLFLYKPYIYPYYIEETFDLSYINYSLLS
jgi:hypothetical protein